MNGKVKFLTGMALASLALGGWAMPTRAQFQKALPLVREVLADDNAAVRAGSMKPVEAGNNALAHAKDASLDEASRYLFFESAFSHYVRGEEYDKAAEVVAQLKASVKDVPDAAVAELIERRLKNVSRKHAGQLYALLREARMSERVAKMAATYRAQLKANPDNAVVAGRLAAANVLLDDWPAALEAFAKGSGEVKAIVAAEKGEKKMSSEKIADFWWSYHFLGEDFDDFTDSLDEAFKAHAALWYRKSLDAGELSGMKRQVILKRIDRYAAPKQEVAVLTPDAEPEKPVAKEKDPIVVKPGKQFVFELAKDLKMEFLECPAGTFFMGNKDETRKNHPHYGHMVTITRPFYMTKYPVTCEQMAWAVKMFKIGGIPKPQKEVQKIAYDLWGGKIPAKCGKPEAFAEKLTKRYRSSLKKGYVVRLPTEAEMEYAFRANVGSDLKSWADTRYWKKLSGPDFSVLRRYLTAAGKKDWDFESRNHWVIKILRPEGPIECDSVLLPVDAYPENEWGIVRASPRPFLYALDRVNADAALGSGEDKGHFVSFFYPFLTKNNCDAKQQELVYADKEVDPLRLSGENRMCFIETHKLAVRSREFALSFYFVIGPDLEAEKQGGKTK